jgi:hypothetical protein
VTDDDVESPRRESVRLRNSVSDINMPMDILVVPTADLKRSAHDLRHNFSGSNAKDGGLLRGFLNPLQSSGNLFVSRD